MIEQNSPNQKHLARKLNRSHSKCVYNVEGLQESIQKTQNLIETEGLYLPCYLCGTGKLTETSLKFLAPNRRNIDNLGDCSNSSSGEKGLMVTCMEPNCKQRAHLGCYRLSPITSPVDFKAYLGERAEFRCLEHIQDRDIILNFNLRKYFALLQDAYAQIRVDLQN